MKDRLERTLATLEGHRAGLAHGRDQLRGRAREQLDTMGDNLETVRHHILADEHGGVIGHQYHRARLHEREQLARLAHGR